MTKLGWVLAGLATVVVLSLVLVRLSRNADPSDPRRLIAAIALPVGLVSLVVVVLATGPTLFE